MFQIFTKLADWSVLALGLDLNEKFTGALHFFIEDTTKIFILIYLLIFIISLFREQLSPEKIRRYLKGKNLWYGYFLAALLGIITPFCSCSSIPLFIAFLTAGIPFGITMAFLISSPLISEIAAFLLFTMEGAGPKTAFAYIAAGVMISVIGGYLADRFSLDKLLNFQFVEPNKSCSCKCSCGCKKNTKQKAVNLIKNAHFFAWETIKQLYLYIIFGLIIGAAIHGYVPIELIGKYLGTENPFAVPLAAIAGAPIYANHAGVIPIIQALLLKGVPIGTAMVILMSITAISLPEMMMLKKVLSLKLIALFLGYLIVSFITVGYMLNWIMG